MNIYLYNLWDRMRTGFWFTPGLITFAATGLAFLFPKIDMIQGEWVTETAGIAPVSASAAQALLSAIASAMITVTGVVFSITMVTLSIASSQFGPRLLRTFISSRATQVSLGVFLGTSVYCLLVMAQIRREEEYAWVPQVSVFLGVFFLIAGVAFLIYYIHSIALLIQAPNVVQTVARDLDEALERLFPKKREEKHSDRREDISFKEDLARLDLGDPDLTVPATFEGYLQGIDVEGLFQLAKNREVLFAVPVRPGQFVVRDATVVQVWADKDLSEEDLGSIASKFLAGNRPTPRQDIECCINELVEVAIRALSPGINDPLTALSCIDRITAVVGRLMERLPRKRQWEENGKLRLLVSEPTYSNILETAYTMIRQYGRDSAPVMIRLMERMSDLVKRVPNRSTLKTIEDQVSMIMRSCEEFLPENEDIQDARAWYKKVRDSIEEENLSKR
jgi:uncharacterized membrane protein